MKFSDEDLQKLLDQNLSKAEIAQNLGVTKETVRYRTNQLKSKQKSIDPEILNLETETDRIDCKSALTLQEQIFLDLNLIEKKSIKDAMIQAGYQDLPERTIYFRAKKILQKYESRAEDHRNIMRAVGAGEVAVISKMWEEAQTAQSAVARVQALTTLGKWLGLAKEVVEGVQGVTIVIQAPDPQQQAVSPGPPPLPALPGPPPYQHPQPARPGEPITIIK
jgi:orotate phosphoribosyltransferase-like protein